ncbi:DNA polymerase III subunit beta [Gracilibacillus sp. YIM 98692]|uniref:DNA polymerase III subunit beta n=1 Tax=Gracilibacillus sp. YIM 98692 TaxID=2663532 RepID=UPI0013CFDBF0|nr:DNA polymerase III subunit beta [Gracilibacillus sp. YIM 98692]
MKFTVNNNTLLEALNKVSKVVTNKGNVPVLSNIYCEVNETELTLIGSNSQESITHRLPVDDDAISVSTIGSTLLPKKTVDIVKKVKKDITFSLEDNCLEIKSGKSKFNLNTMDPEEFPKIPEVSMDKPTITFQGGEFKTFIIRTAFAAAKSESRPVLQGVQYRVEDNCLFLNSTDSHRLAQVQYQTNETEDMSIIVPANALDVALKIFDDKETVEIFMKDDISLHMKNGDTIFTTRLLDGNYPDVNRLIPEDFKTVIKMNRKEMLEGLELVGEITEGDQSITKLHINGVASFQAHGSQRGNGKIDIPYLELEGEDDFTLSFSIPYAVEALKAMEADVVEAKFVDPMKPFLLTPKETTDIEELQLILPVRTI